VLKYHGTPITPLDRLYELAGRNFCVRYGAHDQAQRCHEIGQSVMLDNGAYSFWTKGHSVDWAGYYEWAKPWLDYQTTWAVIPDVIDGTEEENDQLIDEWYEHGLPRGAPVWHMHESLERLDALCAFHERVCIGSSGTYAVTGTNPWRHRMDEAFNLICGNGPPPVWIHMLRAMDEACSGEWPFASTDSTNVAQNHHRSHETPLKIAERWDAKQAPARWMPRSQLELVG
jgi:hypothetical protein